MNKTASWKRTAFGTVTLLAAATLAACGSSASKSGDTSTYTYVYGSDPESLDYTVVNKSSTGDVVGNLVDGLLEQDSYGNLVPSLAEDWKVSADGLTYTYTIREDAKWFTADGEEYADITAEDFVTGLKYAVEKKAEALYLIQDSIVGLSDYMDGKTTDFSTVGVKAIDEKTVQYTLNQPESFWNSKLTMGIMFPVNAEFLASKGEDYGTPNPDNILYSGPYLLSALTTKSAIEYTKNPNYWDADHVYIESIKLTYNDGSDPEGLIKKFADGTYTGATVYPTTASYSDVKKEYGDYINYSLLDGTTYYGIFNLNRSLYNLTGKTTDAEKESTRKAILNKDFRQAITFAFDRHSYNAQRVGEDGADAIIRNTITPDNFVMIGDKEFGDVVEEKVAAYGDEWSGVDLSDGQNSLFNAEKAKAEFAKAKSALEAEGVTFPIKLDVPVMQTAEILVQSASSMKQSIEDTLGKENVEVNLIPVDEDTYYNATYYVETPDQNDYDLSITSGWGPDYDDPSTYLDIYDTEKGSMLHSIGLMPGENADLAAQIGLDKYTAILKEAAQETTNLEARYTKYAEAQAWLTDSAVIIPNRAFGGTPSVSKIVPFTRAYGFTGIKNDESFKYMKIQKDTVTVKEREKAYEKWVKEKAESNAKYQEELASHVE